MPAIFVCYRREDSAPYAGRLYDRLAAQFGDDRIFMDVDAIRPGEDFVEILERKLGACDVLIAVIGKHWLGSVDAAGKRRLDDSGDFVRMEILEAMIRKIRIIPALVGGARMPVRADLPTEMQLLARRQGIEITDTRFHRDVDLLIRALEAPEEMTDAAAGPRVMSYEVDVDGTVEERQVPFVLGVLGDFAGHGEHIPARLRDRRFVDVDNGTFAEVFRGTRPRLKLTVRNALTRDDSMLAIDLEFSSLQDFEPGSLVWMVEPLSKLADVREGLINLRTVYAGDVAAVLRRLLGSSDIVERLRGDAAVAAEVLRREVEDGRLEGTDPQDLDRVERGLVTLLSFLGDGPVPTPEQLDPTLHSYISELDARLADQVREIVDNDAFLQLEGSWRGLHYLVTQAAAVPSAKIRFLNASKSDVTRDMERSAEFGQSNIFRAICEEEYGTLGGEPFGAVIGDYLVGRHPKDMFLVERMSGVAAAAHSVFICGVSPEMFGFRASPKLVAARDLFKRFDEREYAKWRSFRESADSRYVTMVMPRVLVRHGDDRTFHGDERVHGETSEVSPPRGAYANGAYALGAALLKAFDRHGWCAALDGIAVDDLPLASVPTDDGKGAVECCTEIAITEHWRQRLAEQGFLPLCHREEDGVTVLRDSPTCHKPPRVAAAMENLIGWCAAQLAFVFPFTRTVHVVTSILRTRFLGARSREEVEKDVNAWLVRHVLANHGQGEIAEASPFREIRLQLSDDPGAPTRWRAALHVLPRVDLERIPPTLKVPGAVKMPDGRPLRVGVP